MSTAQIHIRDFAQTLPEYLVDFDDFIIIKTIGKGGFGEVYLAEHKKTRITCALKKLTLSEDQFEGQHEKYFIREVDILSKTKNPFLLRLLGFSDHYPFCIATEYISKGSLYDAIHHKPGSPILDGTQLTIIALVIAMGLQSLHKQNIVHRDIKSLNILLDENLLPHVCDFGISREINDKSDDRVAMTGQLGTTNWMAPEMFNDDDSNYGTKVDVYAYGIMLWEMLTGEIPFGNKKAMAIMSEVTRGNRPKIPETTPQPLTTLISSCWAQRPEDRPTFDQVVKALKKHKAKFADTDDQRVDQVINWLNSQTVVPLTQRQVQSQSESNQQPYFSKIIENPEDPNYESACISAIRGMKPEQFSLFLNIIMMNFMKIPNKQVGVHILDAIASLLSHNLDCTKVFVSYKFFNSLPYNIPELIPSCNKVFESLFQDDISFITEELISYGIRICQISPLSSLTALSNYIYHVDGQYTEQIIYWIIQNQNYKYYDFKESSELLIDTLYYYASQKPHSQYLPTIFKVIEYFLGVSNERTIDAAYRALIELRVKDFTVPTEMLVRHLKFDSLALSVMLYLTTSPPSLLVTPDLIKELIEYAQKDQLAVFVLCQFADRDDLAQIILQNYALWLFTNRLPIADSMRIFLVLMCKVALRPELAKIPQLSKFFRRVVESRNKELIDNIPSIISRLLDYIPETFYVDCTESQFLLYYLHIANEMASEEMLSSGIEIVESLARKMYIQDYLQFVALALQFITKPNSQPDLIARCISFLYLLSLREESKMYLAQCNLQVILQSANLRPELGRYAMAILQNISK